MATKESMQQRTAAGSGSTATATATATTVNKPPDSYKFRYNFVAGAIALPLSFAIMHPVDTIKTRMQAVATKTVSGSFSKHMAHAIRESGTALLSRGFMVSVLGAAPQGGLRLGCYNEARDHLGPYIGNPLLRNALAACMGDIASSVVKVPREILVQRLQTGMYNSSGEAVRSILRDDGFKGFFRGYWSTALRDLPFMAVLFVSYEQFKVWKIRISTADSRRNDHPDKPWSDGETVLWGGFSGALAGWSTTPFDVVKTRIMTATGKNLGTVAVLKQVLMEEGPAGLFVGAMPRAGWWFCVCSIFFASFERLRSTMSDAMETPA
eukprot:Clim_evm23s88 gene=Clim_evmTU23s88